MSKKSKKTEAERIFQVESKQKQKEKDDKTKRENRNRKVSYLLTDKVECKIQLLTSDYEDGLVIEKWGTSIKFETSDGDCVLNFYGKNKNGADRLVRLFLDKLDVKYKIRRGKE